AAWLFDAGRFFRFHRGRIGRVCRPRPEKPPDPGISDDLPHRRHLSTGAHPRVVRGRASGYADSRAADHLGRRVLCRRHSVVLRQPVSADPDGHQQARHHHPIRRPCVSDRLGLPRPRRLAFAANRL
ncbi:COG2363, partial [Pseudomonas fluorescens]